MRAVTVLQTLSSGSGFVHLRLGESRTVPEAHQAFRQLMAALGQNVSRDPQGRSVEEAIVRASPMRRTDPCAAC